MMRTTHNVGHLTTASTGPWLRCPRMMRCITSMQKLTKRHPSGRCQAEAKNPIWYMCKGKTLSSRLQAQVQGAAWYPGLLIVHLVGTLCVFA